MFNALRNKLPRLAASKFTAQAPNWSERASSGSDSDDDCELLASTQRPFSPTMWPTTLDRSHFRFGDRVDGRTLHNNRMTHPWHEADKQRHHQLASAAHHLKNHCGGMENVLVMNLGDPWTDPTQLRLFDHRVVDFPSSGKNVAPGSDLIPLDILFTICSSMHSWLRINDKNVTFLHANSPAVGSGEETLKFVVGCYLAYLGDSEKTLSLHHSSLQKMESGGAHWNVNDKAFATPQEADSDVSQVMYSIGIDTNKIDSYGGPARKRYAQYFLSILYTPNPPPSQNTPLAIDHVIISGLDEIKTNLRVTRLLSERWKDSLLHPVLVIYQGGKLKWKEVVPIKDSTVEVSPEVSVTGDSVVGLWFVKDCISTNDPPVVAFSFHSAFMEAGIVRLSSGDLSCLGMDMRHVLDNPACNVTMELTLTYGESSDEEEDVPSISLSDYRNKWLAQTGGLLPSIYATVENFQKTEIPSRRLPSPLSERLPQEIEKKAETEIPRIQTMDPVKKEKEVITNEAPATSSAAEDSIAWPALSDHRTTEIDKDKEASTSAPAKEVEEKPKKKVVTRAPAPPPPPPPRSKARRSSSISLTPSPSLKNRPISKTRSFFWDITPKQSGTVWSALTQGDLKPEHLNMLETLFCNDDQLKSKNTAVTTAPSVKKSGSTMALSVGRANNVSIMMTRFKHFSGIDEICTAVLSEDGMTDEELDLLSQIGPTEGEIRDLKEHDEKDLSVPEKILVAMTVVPRLRIKAACQLAIRTWEKNYSEAIDMLQTIKIACQQIRESKRLQSVLATVLSVGNTMNRGTSRGNAGGIKIDSLSRLWDTRVSGKISPQSSNAETESLKRAGSVPTAISQALEGPRVEEKITTLLDFMAMIIRDKDVASGSENSTTDYLLVELECLPDAVCFLEDGVSDLLSEVDKGFDLLEREFRSMSGKQWSAIESSSVPEIKIRHCENFVDEQRAFLVKTHRFLMEAGGARNFLKQEESVVEQHLSAAVQWLGEMNSNNPKQHLKCLLEFAKRFDHSYQQLQPCIMPISE